MANWQFVLADTSGDLIEELTMAASRQVTWNLDDAATATFTLPGTHVQALLVQDLATDLIVYRDGTKVFRGRIAQTSDPLAANGYTATFTANDYRWMLTQRFFQPADTLTYNEEQTAIVSALVAATQAKPGGDWGVTVPTVTTGVTRDRAFNVGASIGGTITTLGDTTDGFDWEVDADLNLNIFYPARGRVGTAKLDYGGSVIALTRSVASGTYGNAVMTTGGNNLVATAEASSFGPAGRWEQVYSDTDINDSATLAARASFLLSFADQPPPTYQATLLDGWWSPAEVWLGDVVGLFAKVGRLNIDSAVRCNQFQVSLGDDGGETVVVALGPTVIKKADDTVVPAGSATGSGLDPTDTITPTPAATPTTPTKYLLGLGQQIAVVSRRPIDDGGEIGGGGGV